MSLFDILLTFLLQLHLLILVFCLQDINWQHVWLEWGESFADCIELADQKKPDSWLRLSNTLRQYDQDKVQDCKEDIDTLLVFVRPVTKQHFS